MCLYPKLIENKKYLPNKKNGGNPPKLTDERLRYVPVGCGNCIECRKQKARDWQVRLNEEVRHSKNSNFITLTFNEPSLKALTEEVNKSKKYHALEENEIAKIAVRRFLERWRKKYKKSLKHWLITELGHTGTERIHLHGLIWFNDTYDIVNNRTGEITTLKLTRESFKQELETIWNYGFTDTGQYVNEKSVNYIVKYMTKIDSKHKGYKPKILCSAGLGSKYLERIDSRINQFNGTETKDYYKTKTGIKLALPTYYKNKIYTDEEREELWKNRIDTGIQYICGEKFKTDIDDKKLTQIYEYFRLKNKRLGYGDDSKDYNIETYKRSRKYEKQRNRKNKS